jgi:hypothetical protein
MIGCSDEQSAKATARVLLFKGLDMVRPSKAPTEVELKFLLLPRERLAVARNSLLAGATTQTDLSSVYYDTPDTRSLKD